MADAAYIVAMGCSIDELVPDGWDETAERWEIEDPRDDDLDAGRNQRDEIRRRVGESFDRIGLSNE
ncbi:hypothetical protein GCM10009037_24470 [Halarchaeum grantii]|uniref:Low molecular weight phosphotyrosine protein phosphatase n=1 Tax=Halarchaeum grantii TaxID=1193105 RepID=A0A830F516_9EURY|nr:hypothetical protein [Halarchaeum grantii]GGL39798.1 hypothetical protein GCM10009037_24470 [Halarchaeum grantii]